MKLNINRACDLSSISVLPPRRSSGMSSGGDGLGRGQASQIRSQSQHSFSQGVSLSQLSQSSFDEALTNDQRISSQEKDNSLKNIPKLAPIASSRDESQLQIPRASSNILHKRWSAASFSDNRFQVNEALDHKLQLIESSINRVGMILDSVQSDVMQVNRAVKELSLEAGGIRQKIGLLENSMQQMLKLEDNIKISIGGSLTSISDKLINDSTSVQLNEIAKAVSSLQEQFVTRLTKLEFEICQTFSKKEVRESGVNCSDIKYLNEVQLPVLRNQSMKHSMRESMSLRKAAVVPLMTKEQRSPLIKREEGKTIPVTSKVSEQMQMMRNGCKILHRKQGEKLRIDIDSDESDGDISCRILNKEAENKAISYQGKQRNLMEEVQQETLRILRKARKRKRKHMNLIAVD